MRAGGTSLLEACHTRTDLEDDGAAPRVANDKRALKRLPDDQVKVDRIRRVHVQQRRPAHGSVPFASIRFTVLGAEHHKQQRSRMRASAAVLVVAACLLAVCEARVDVIRSVENPHMEVGLRVHPRQLPGSCAACLVW